MTEPGKTKRSALKYVTFSVTGTLIIGFAWWFTFRNIAYTDDAYVEGNKVVITPLVSGFVTAIHTDDTFPVSKGQLLVQLDTSDATIAFDAAKETLAVTIRKVCRDFHTYFALESEVEAKKAEFIKAAQDFEHRRFVVEAGGVSTEDFEHAIAALRSSFFLLQMTEFRKETALASIRNTAIFTHPEVLAAAETVRQTRLNLHRCTIRSPVEGLVAMRSIQVGMWVPQGTPLLTVIPLDQIWVNANFKETQMKRMRIGQRVKLRSDLYGFSAPFTGKIVGLPGGAGNAFSILPPQNLSGNWIKIVQRLPVRVAIDKESLSTHPLRIGLTMEAEVDLQDPGTLLPVPSEPSPSYVTSIFAEEERGEETVIRSVLAQNADPTLSEFFEYPFTPDPG